MNRKCVHKLFLLVLASTAVATGQFQSLSTNVDGSILYFSSPLRLVGTDQPNHGKLFVVDGSGLHLFMQRSYGAPLGRTVTNFYDLRVVELSADGSLLGYTATRECDGFSSCAEIQRDQANVMRLSDGAILLQTGGRLTMSRDGRFAVTSLPTGIRWHDLANGKEVVPPYVWPFAARWITSDGSVLITDSQTDRIIVWSPSREQKLPLSHRIADFGLARINESGTRIAYWSDKNELIAYDVSTHSERVVTVADTALWFETSNDGSAIFYLKLVSGVPQVFETSLSDFSNRQITQIKEGIRFATISDNGRVMYTATRWNRILRIGLLDGEIMEVIPRTPYVTVRKRESSAGSLLAIRGSGFAESTISVNPPLLREIADISIQLDGLNIPIQKISPEEILFQLPWSTSIGPHELKVTSGHSPFEVGDQQAEGLLGLANPKRTDVNPCAPDFWRSDPDDLYSRLLTVHEDFGSTVTLTSRAKAGETIHLYMSGLGEVKPTVADGERAGSTSLSALVAPAQFQVIMNSRADPAENAVWEGLAPGMVGVYQVDLRLPLALTDSDVFVRTICGQAFGGGFVPVEVSPK